MVSPNPFRKFLTSVSVACNMASNLIASFLWVQDSGYGIFNVSWNVDPPRSHPGGCINIKMSSYKYRGPHVNDKTVSRPSYL